MVRIQVRVPLSLSPPPHVHPKFSQVALRIRPMNTAELAEGARPIAHRVDEQVVVLRDPMEDPDDILRASRSREKSYIFDVAFDSTATQETVYHATTRSLIMVVVSGYNATVFTYGTTGCGKTYTMLGTDGEPGICARTLGDLFQAIQDTSGDVEYEVSMSYLEIYNEMIRDLMNPSLGCLQLREDAGGTVRVAGITEVSATNADEVMQLLARGNRQRTQEPTAANRTSSRSHAVLQVTVRRRRRGRGLRHGRLFLIDLAGSERAAQTQNHGQRMKEGAHINRSLLALGNCIKALSHRTSTRYINYRDSKLTRLLKDSLGGNSHTVMIAHISPASTAFEESRSTLAYAQRAKSIRSTVRHNLPGVSYSVMADLHRGIQCLKGQGDAKPGQPGQGKHQDIPYIQAQVRLCGDRPKLGCVREDLLGTCRDQAALRDLLLRLEGTTLRAQHLLTLAGTRQDQQWSKEEQGELNGPGDSEGDSDAGDEQLDVPEPPSVAVAHKSIATLLEEQGGLQKPEVWDPCPHRQQLKPHPQKSEFYKSQPSSVGPPAALGVHGCSWAEAELVQHFWQRQQGTQRLEEALRHQRSWEEQREVLALLCRLHQLELELTESRSHTLLKGGLQHLPATTMRHFDWHQALCACIIQQQHQLITDHRLPVPQPLEELYETYLRELAEGPGETGTLKVGQDTPTLPAHAGPSPPVPAQGTSLPKIPQVAGTESLPASDWDSVWAQSCEHPAPPQQGPRCDTLPPLRPTGDRYSIPTPMVKKTPQAQHLGSTAVPAPTSRRGTVLQEHTPRASLASLRTRHDSFPGSRTGVVATRRGEPSGQRGCVGGHAPLTVPPCHRVPRDVKQHQEHRGQGYPALGPHPGERPLRMATRAGWPRAVAHQQRGQPGGDSHPLPGSLGVGVQEGWQGAREEGGIDGCQKDIKAVTVLRGHQPRCRCRYGGAVPPARRR
ncbi:kinesin-like protein KIF19 isoform X2 [Falco biarmicus]|uniref:kinesin-like protein KIF19 isoform X2 n=1 Tax=Falco biarmicus TaxID=345155 RepID=UPI0024BD23A5|nr:kinesin-like protein KIF19 isoform X2 [Falco biarmicus]